MRELSEKLRKDFTANEYTDYDLAFLVEFGYVLGTKQAEMDKFDELLEYTLSDGIELFSMFVQFCYNEYEKTTHEDYLRFFDNELENLIEKFKNNYFEEEE